MISDDILLYIVIREQQGENSGVYVNAPMLENSIVEILYYIMIMVIGEQYGEKYAIYNDMQTMHLKYCYIQ